MSIASLVTKPTVTEEARRESVEKLRELLTEAERGDIAELYVLIKHPNGNWSSVRSSSINEPELIGRFEIAKWNSIKAYLEQV